ncbi:MAG: helix-turn-helix domain-containing protein [Nitrospirae bacterium YQR-1]
MEKLIPLSEVRKNLNISRSTLWKWIKEGRLMSVTLSERKVYIEETELNRFIRDSKKTLQSVKD